MARSIVLRAFLLLPIAFVAAFLLAPLGLTIAVSFWQRVGLSVRPAFVFIELPRLGGVIYFPERRR